MSSFSATKGCKHRCISSVRSKNLGRYLGQYANNSHALLVVEVYIK